MATDSQRIAEATYAGVLGKLIGVYLGRPVEGWAYDAIRRRFGEVDGYVHEPLGLPLVVADDDLSGSFGFFRALEETSYARTITAADFGDTWLNTIIEDKTILWWGGLGRSTEHTAYLRLKAGYRAPQSGSCALNGAMLSTQIGAQIFTDPLALMSPGNPEQAAALIRTAASVSHDGVALDCAAYLGALQALAFEHRSLEELLEEAQPFAAGDQLRRLLDDVRHICSREHDWRRVRAWLDPRYGYGVFPGPCPILSNHAMLLAALLLGGDDFRRALMIAASAGYDTDCNAGNVGCLNGVRLGLAAIPTDLREPVADRLLVVTAEGGRCVSDAVQETRSILLAGAAFTGAPLPARQPRFSFELPGARQGFAPCPHAPPDTPSDARSAARGDTHRITQGGAPPDARHHARSAESPTPIRVEGSAEAGLLLHYRDLTPASPARVSTPVFLDFDQVADNFSTHASPTLYPTQEVTIRLESVRLFRDTENQPQPPNALPAVALYALYYDADDQVQQLRAAAQPLRPGDNTLHWRVPANGGMPPFRLGLELAAPGTAPVGAQEPLSGSLRLLSVDWDGAPQDLRQRGMLMSSIWNLRPRWLRAWVSARHERRSDVGHARLARLRRRDRTPLQLALPGRPGTTRARPAPLLRRRVQRRRPRRHHRPRKRGRSYPGADVVSVCDGTTVCAPVCGGRRPPRAGGRRGAAARGAGRPLPERRRRLRDRRGYHARRRIPGGRGTTGEESTWVLRGTRLEGEAARSVNQLLRIRSGT